MKLSNLFWVLNWKKCSEKFDSAISKLHFSSIQVYLELFRTLFALIRNIFNETFKSFLGLEVKEV